MEELKVYVEIKRSDEFDPTIVAWDDDWESIVYNKMDDIGEDEEVVLRIKKMTDQEYEEGLEFVEET